MNSFKSNFSFKGFLFTTSLILLTVSGCIRGANTNDQNSSEKTNTINQNATFTTTELGVQGRSDVLSTSSVWGTPTRMRYSLEVCFESKATNQRLPQKVDFNIITESGLIYKDKTNNDGCIQWQETLPFNFFADSKYLKSKRTFKSLSNQFPGSFENVIALNPWIKFRNESEKEVIDLQRNSGDLPNDVVVKNISGYETVQQFNEQGSAVQLYVDGTPDIRFHSNLDVGNTKLVQSSIEFKPFVVVKNMFGRKERHYFDNGRFDINLQVIVNDLDNEKTSLRLTPDSDKTVFSDVPVNVNNNINHEFKWILSEHVTTGNLNVAIKVAPSGGQLAEVNAIPFEGRFLIGDYAEIFSNPIKFQVSGNMKTNNDEESPFNFSDYTKNVLTTKETREAGLSRPLTPINYGDLTPRFVQIEPGETAMARTVNFRVQTRVTDGVEANKLEVGQKFTIYKREFKDPLKMPVPPRYNAKTGVLEGGFEEVQETTSKDNGIINWTDEISHEYYIPEKYYFREYVIRHHRSNNIQSKAVAINPWDDKWTFGADLNGDDKKTIVDRNSRPKREPRFMVDAFRYQTIRFRYEIDQFMNLNVKKAVVMALDPLVQRDRITEGRSFLPLRDGIYLVKIALVRHYIDPFKSGVHLFRPKSGSHRVESVRSGGDLAKGIYTTVVKKLLRVQGGRITTPLEFSMRDLRMMSIRSNIMVQIQPVDEDKLFAYNILNQKLTQLGLDYESFQTAGEEEQNEFFIQSVKNRRALALKTFLSENFSMLKNLFNEFDLMTLQKQLAIINQDYNIESNATEASEKEPTAKETTEKEAIVNAQNSIDEILNLNALNYATDLWAQYKKLQEEERSAFLKKELSLTQYTHFQKIQQEAREAFLSAQSTRLDNELNNMMSYLELSKKELNFQRSKVGEIHSERKANIDTVFDSYYEKDKEQVTSQRMKFYSQTRDQFQSYMKRVRENFEGLEYHLASQRAKVPVEQWDIAQDDEGRTFYKKITSDYKGGSLRGKTINDPQNAFSPMALAPRIGKVDIDPDNPSAGQMPLFEAIDPKDTRLGEANISSSNGSSLYKVDSYPEDVLMPINALPETLLQNAMSSNNEELIYSPSAYDFIGSMQNFLNDKQLGQIINKDDLNAMKLNDYTSRPAAPLVDLDNLIYQYKEDKELALKSRTFIGPCTLVADDNMSEMRPTDTIDEKYCERVDCSEDLYKRNDDGLFQKNPSQKSFLDDIQLKKDNSEFENSVYHGSVAPFADMSVDDIIELHLRLENHYVKEMKVLSQVSRFVETNDLLYSTLSNPDINKPAENDLKKFIAGCDYDKHGEACFSPFYEKALPDGTMESIYIPEEDLLNELNVNHPDFIKNEVLNILSTTGQKLADLQRKNITTNEYNILSKQYENTSPSEYSNYRLQKDLKSHIEMLLQNKYLPEEKNYQSNSMTKATIKTQAISGKTNSPYSEYYKNLIHQDKSSLEINTEDIRSWLNKGSKSLQIKQVPQICNLVTRQIADRYKNLVQVSRLGQLKDKDVKSLHNALLKKCIDSTIYFPSLDVVNTPALQFHRQDKVKKTGTFEHLSGKNMNLALGKEFAIASFDSKSTDQSKSFNHVAVAGALGVAVSVIMPGLSPAVAGAGAISAAGLGAYGLTDSTAESLGYTLQSASKVEASTFLVVQQAEVKIEILAYEKCLIMGLNKGLFINESLSKPNAKIKAIKKEGRKLGLSDNYYPHLMTSAMNRGHMICDGKITTEPTSKIEKYYYVTQHFTAGDILDNGSLLNHVWLLSLRGEGDFKRFTQLVGAREINAKGKEVGFESAVYPLDVLDRAYSQVRPSFPGMITNPVDATKDN